MWWTLLDAIMGAASGLLVVAITLKGLGLDALPVPLWLGACAGTFAMLLIRGGTR